MTTVTDIAPHQDIDPGGRPMSDYPGVHNIIGELDAYVRRLSAERDIDAQRAHHKTERIQQIVADMSELRAAAALVNGQPTELLPADIKASDSPLSLTIGGLKLAPHPGDPMSLRRFAAVARALYETTTHLAVVATDMADALDPEAAHVRGQATLQTQKLPALTGKPGIETGLCRHCNREVYMNGTGWLHPDGVALCHPNESLDVAEPLEAICTCLEEVDPWCSEHRSSYPTEPAVSAGLPKNGGGQDV